LIERAQFALNKRIYEAGAFKADMGFEGSWLEWFLFETESFHGRWDLLCDKHPATDVIHPPAKARRYTRSAEL